MDLYENILVALLDELAQQPYMTEDEVNLFWRISGHKIIEEQLSELPWGLRDLDHYDKMISSFSDRQRYAKFASVLRKSVKYAIVRENEDIHFALYSTTSKGLKRAVRDWHNGDIIQCEYFLPCSTRVQSEKFLS